MDNQNLEYNLPQNAYVNFDALSLKAYMIEQLNKGGKFTDQNYEGSNISAIMDVLAYYTHVLMFYLNQTSSESMFTQTQIYENMNRIVKLIDYKPIGKQTSLCSLNCVASANLTPSSYLIRKYSYFLVDNIQYTFNDDFQFEKATTSAEDILSINDNAILYQGRVAEYPTYIATGEDYETFPIVVDNLVSNSTSFVSHGTVSVYVKEKYNDQWYEYSEVDTLFLTESTDRVYALRLNENGHYEVKFGNSIFGRRLQPEDEVVVFYILSDGDKGLISKNSINGNKLFVWNNSKFNEIYSNINTLTSDVVDQTYSALLTFTNPNNSTLIQEAETVDQIRENSPVFLSSQLRLVTEQDYEKFLKVNIPNILNDVKVVDNNIFISQYIKYFYDICVDPNKVNRVLLNQVNYADSCDFNNVNVFCVPKFTILNDGDYPEFLTNSFKALIKEITKDKKIISNEVVPRDPIYMAVDIGYSNDSQSIDIVNDSNIIVTRSPSSKKSKDKIKNEIAKAISDYFSSSNVKLGQIIDISQLTSNILQIEGVGDFRIFNNTTRETYNGLSLSMWNPLFPDSDNSVITQTIYLPFFKYPYLINPVSLPNKITVIDE